MKRLMVESWLLLIFLEIIICFRGLSVLIELIRKWRVRSMLASERVSSERIARAVDLASVFYFKRVLCLQRSAATTLALRWHGWNAEMVIGAKMMPFKSHAWVEIDGAVVNDRPYMAHVYRSLERC
jgi:hypothetical protein